MNYVTQFGAILLRFGYVDDLQCTKNYVLLRKSQIYVQGSF